MDRVWRPVSRIKLPYKNKTRFHNRIFLLVSNQNCKIKLKQESDNSLNSSTRLPLSFTVVVFSLYKSELHFFFSLHLSAERN